MTFEQRSPFLKVARVAGGLDRSVRCYAVCFKIPLLVLKERVRKRKGHEGNVEVIELRDGSSGDIYITEPDKNVSTIRRIKVVREEDD